MTQQAADRFATLAAHLRTTPPDTSPQTIAHFLIRCLFCLFTEDFDLLHNNVFTKLVEQGRVKTDRFTAQLRQLFAAMATCGYFGVEGIRHFDGGHSADRSSSDRDSGRRSAVGLLQHRTEYLRRVVRARPRSGSTREVGRAVYRPRGHRIDRGGGADGAAAPPVGRGGKAGARSGRGEPIDSIEHRDAILNPDGTEPDWPECEVLVGNPPFLGDKNMRTEMGDKYVEALRKLHTDRIPRQSDLVCYWFEKVPAMIEQGKAKRAGLLATQAIRAGASCEVLKRIKDTGNIFWAQSDRERTPDGAAVRVSYNCRNH